MKILQVNKFHYIEGGTERYYLELSKLLKSKGHQVAFFSMSDKRNYKTKWSKYFVSNISFNKVNIYNGFRVINRMIYSIEAKIKINKLLDTFNPDIVHIHNIYNHISPSILPEIKRRGIPIVQTIHDYHQIAPNRNLFHDGKVCEITKKNKYYLSIFHKCVKNSVLASLLTVITLYLHSISRIYKKIDYLITPSIFIKQKLVEYGFILERIIINPNFIQIRKLKFNNKYNKNKYILFLGRLSPEKGITTLIEVVRRLNFIQFKIIGTGPQEEFLKKSVQRNNLKNVDVLGYQSEMLKQNLIRGSFFSLVPSLWYEGFGMVILEANIMGKPVVASRIGGIPEVVKDGYNGLLFEPGNVEDCISKILKLWTNPHLVMTMGRYARKYVEQKFNSEDHYNHIMAIYKSVINKNRVFYL